MRKIPFQLMILALAASPAHAAGPADAEMQRRLALAQRYETLIHREKLIEDEFASQLRLIWDACTDDACRSSLNQAIEKAVSESAPAQERAVVTLMASRLTEDQLRAAIRFAQSPQGQAIVAAEAAMGEDVGRIAHNFSKEASTIVRHSFCASQAEACARVFARLAGKPPSHP